MLELMAQAKTPSDELAAQIAERLARVRAYFATGALHSDPGSSA